MMSVKAGMTSDPMSRPECLIECALAPPGSTSRRPVAPRTLPGERPELVRPVHPGVPDRGSPRPQQGALTTAVTVVDPPDLKLWATLRHLFPLWWAQRRLVGIGLTCAL